MAPAKPMLGDIELQLVQEIQVDSDQVLVPHSVPALEGDLLQRLDRRATQITLSGVLTGPEAKEGLKKLREKFRAAEPVPFAADIATATRVDRVIIEEMGVRELAGKPERFEYAFTLREYIPPPAVAREAPPEIPAPESPAEQIDQRVGTLTVEVTVEGQPEFDFSHVSVTVEGTGEDGASLSRTLTNRTDNLWTEENFPAGSYTIRAAANPRPISGLAQAEVQAGGRTPTSITLHPTSNIARTFIVHFRFDRAFVEPCMRPVLRQVAGFASDHSGERLVVVGHTDKAGSADYNQSLSERRARAVFAFLTVGVNQASRDAALAEWNDLRQKRPPSELPSIKDSWGAREYQHMLQDLGFYPGPVDGRHGPLTDDAVRAYRCHKGLPPGTVVDDEVWQALIEDYLTREPLAVPVAQFFPNCTGEILKWLGCGEEDPLDRRETAFRPSRRVELIFVQTDRLPCQIPQPVTFELPEPGRVNRGWCIGPGAADKRCCLVSPHFRPGTSDPVPCTPAEDGPWCRQPAEPGTITVQGSIQRERADGSLEPAGGQAFVLTAPSGAFKADEQSNGEPTPARTRNDGTFSFDNLPPGFYSLEVIAPATAPVLVRLQEKTDADIRGNAVCKALRSDQDRLDVVIVRAPVLREIRLPVAVHLMTALHPATREVRTCPDPLNPATRVPQRTRHNEDDIQRFFEGANKIWRQARVRFELEPADIVQEAYSFRTECDVDDSEFGILLERCAYHKAVNVFFIADLAGQVEAGVYLKVIVPDVRGTVDGCAVSDKFQLTIITPAPNVDLDDVQTVQVLAHELGHYLSLQHVKNTPANADRLMLPGSISGENRTLGREEIDRARASPNATDSCVPLSLRVTGATRVGGSLSDRFIVVQSPGGVVTVDAQIPDRLLDPARGSLVMTGGNPGANDRQRTVSADPSIPPAETEVVATYIPAGDGQPVISRALIRAATFTLRVDGATQASAGSTTFVARRDASGVVTVTAEIEPAPFCVPSNLVVWAGGTEVPDPLRRTVSRAAIAQTVVSATMAGVTRSVTIFVFEVEIGNIDFIGKNQNADIPIIINQGPMPAGASITLELSTMGGTGEARFTSTNSTIMRIVQSTTVTIRGITESSALDNIRLTARLTNQTQILAQENFTVFHLEVTEIDFQSGIDIYNAVTNSKVPDTGPEWSSSPPVSHPVAYIRTGGGSGLSRDLRINATTLSGFSGTITLKAEGPSGSNTEIGAVDINFSAGVASNASMRFTALPATARRLNNINLQWKYKLSSWPFFANANISTHTLYILDAKPLAGVTAYRELLDFSCEWADGESGAQNVFNKIWAKIVAQATGWKYYGPGQESHTTVDIIRTHNGDCDAWAHFMADCCRLHGIDARHHRIMPGIRASTNLRYNGIVVRNVTYGTVYSIGPPRRTFMNSDSPPGVTGLSTSPSGLPGQGVATPDAKIFNFHAVVAYGGIYYDPSYMVTWANETVFRNALAGQMENAAVEWPAGSGQFHVVLLIVEPPFT